MALQTILHAVLDRVDQVLGVRLARVLAPCVIASALGCVIVVIEPFLTHRGRHSYLIFNLVLAWMPLPFAWLSYRQFQAGTRLGWMFAAAWLLFLPNSPYLFTDLIHLMGRSLPHYWPDLVKILLFAMTGMCVGLISLQLMHGLVTRAKGWMAGWLFVATVSVLCSLGVYLGRFQRWHSWDMLRNAPAILRDIVVFLRHPSAVNHHTGFVVLLAVFIFSSYLIVYALRHAPRFHDTPPAR